MYDTYNQTAVCKNPGLVSRFAWMSSFHLFETGEDRHRFEFIHQPRCQPFHQ